MKKLLFIALLAVLTGCTRSYNDSITCYGNDGKVFYHAENVRVAAGEGHFYVRDTNEKLTVVSGNCVAK